MLTDISEVESRLQNLKKENINLQSLCQDIIDLYEFVAEQKEISLTLMPEVGQENLQINVNRKKIRQALANLIDNAIKYSAENTEIIISFYKLNQYIFIKVIDQGMGIHPDDLPHIWKRLYRGEKSRSEKGIGLGLSLVKSIIEAHNGSIMVQNNNNGGSTFIIELPIT
jgi:signal transduction histidine kinase